MEGDVWEGGLILVVGVAGAGHAPFCGDGKHWQGLAWTIDPCPLLLTPTNDGSTSRWSKATGRLYSEYRVENARAHRTPHRAPPGHLPPKYPAETQWG